MILFWGMRKPYIDEFQEQKLGAKLGRGGNNGSGWIESQTVLVKKFHHM